MNEITAGDLIFIIAVLCLIHGIMAFVEVLRRRKKRRQPVKRNQPTA